MPALTPAVVQYLPLSQKRSPSLTSIAGYRRCSNCAERQWVVTFWPSGRRRQPAKRAGADAAGALRADIMGTQPGDGLRGRTDLVTVARSPAYRRQLVEAGMQPVTDERLSAEGHRHFLASEIRSWAPAIKAAGAYADWLAQAAAARRRSTAASMSPVQAAGAAPGVLPPDTAGPAAPEPRRRRRPADADATKERRQRHAIASAAPRGLSLRSIRRLRRRLRAIVTRRQSAPARRAPARRTAPRRRSVRPAAARSPAPA